MEVLQYVVAQGGVAPSLWRFEVANGLQMAIRRKRIDAAYRAASLVDLAVLPIAIDPDSDRHVWTATVQLAEQHGLTIYDAAYLELAQRRRLPLASLDRALRQAAISIGVPTRGLAA